MKSNKSKTSCKRGFTLIELLVVVLIIGILAAVAVPQYQFAVLKARCTELLTLIKHVKTVQEVYFLDTGHYAENCSVLGIDAPSGYSLSTESIEKNDKHYEIRCAQGRYHGRVAGRMFDTNGQVVLSVEQYLDQGLGDGGEKMIGAPMACWAGGNPLYQKICKSICKDSEWHVEKPATGEGWCEN